MKSKYYLLALAASGLSAMFASSASADFIGMGAGQFAVLGQFNNNQTNFNNGTITGDVGIGTLATGTPHQFTISNASVSGNIRFSGASNTTGLTPDPDPSSKTGPFAVSGGGSVSGNVVANDSAVATALNYVDGLSQTLGGESGTALTLTSSQTINASSGTLDGSGNRIFTTSSVNLNNASTLTIDGTASQYVVVNVSDNNPAFDGAINLTGGITSDHVLFNMFGGNYSTFTGGPTLTISTNGATTTGIFLDPNGGMQINHSVLNGRFWGGDTTNQQIVSGAFINAPLVATPLPSTAIAGIVLLGGLALARRLHSARTA